MNNKTKLIFLLITSLFIVIGTVIVSTNLFSIGNSLAAVVSISLMLGIVGILTLFIRKCYYDLKAGIPSDDERTKKVRMYAAGYAYFISLYVWLLLLAFNSYLDRDDLVMIGLLGMVISFYLSWLILNRKKDIA